MPPADLTIAQAADCARYLLGPDWGAIFAPMRGQVMLVGPNDNFHVGASWREVFRSAGVVLPLRPQYVAKALRVMLGDRAICTATSNTMAKRIAAALNDHITDRRGI